MSQLGSNWELGQIQPLEEAVRAACDRGTVHGQELAAIGINLNLAPVLDVWDNPVNTVIGTRSYSADPERVALLGSAYISALQQTGTGATGKHFPGHGSTVEDSHLRLPVLLHDRARLDEVELVPFRAAIRAGVAAIMTAHISLPLIDTSSARPATMSPVILTGLLRGDLGYDGLILTDDLGAMAAVSDAYSPGQAAVEAISAGADTLTISGPLASQVAARDALLAAVGTQITETRLNESVRRVLTAKQEMGLIPGPALEAPITTMCG
jgi:beta-N-acetylhexosaminidase